ncbi:unnamed protein product [Heligmosomoides polygyrus]|uniref:CCHC-type domain-containing protein n=1 Tax=Heligmosomoides polygyrus TaxID=6339 RepID=A0A183G4J7_HELPZ|nr:unnamed protein product [Heligmosomoides polygyrus]
MLGDEVKIFLTEICLFNAQHEADELARLGFLDELNRIIFYEPTQPGHPKYREVLEIHRNYERSNVSGMVRFQLVQLDALLEEERALKEEAKSHSKLMRRLGDEVLTEIRLAMENLQLEELHERFSELSLEDLPRNRNRLVPTHQPTNDPRNARAGSKRKQPDEDLEELKHEYEKRIRQCEEELHEVTRYLSENITRERHYGDIRMKDSEYHVVCVYCLETGTHYSDACPKYRSVLTVI